MSDQGKSVLGNFIWRFLERFFAQIVTLVVSIVLARILIPSDYGIIGIITVYINILGVFIDSGLGTALIQKKKADDLDFSSVFYCQLGVCVIIYLVVFFTAPYISDFFLEPEITLMLRILGLTLIIAGVKNIQIAYVSRNMMFKKFFISTSIGTIIAAVIGILMALYGFGAWALIVQSLINNLVDTIVLWIIVEWRPKKMFSFDRLINMFSYGWKLLVSALLDTGYENIKTIFIGKLYSKEDLAFYDQGVRWPYAIVGNINASIDSVLLPALSAEQDNKEVVKGITKRAIKISTYVMTPLLVGMAACGEPLFRFLLSDKWLPMVPFLAVFCAGFVFYPIHTANLNAIRAMGKSEIFLKLEIIKKIICISLMVVAVPISPMAICWSTLISGFLCQIVNSLPNKSIIGYGYMEQLSDFLPHFLISAFMGICIYWIKFLPINDLSILFIQFILGISIYTICSRIFGLESYYYLINILKNRFKKHE